MTIADTDVLIDFLGGREPGATAVAAGIDRGDLATTVISRFELLAGARTAKQSAGIRQLLSQVPDFPLDAASAESAAEVRRELDKRGAPIGMGDSLIAGIALRRRARLLTRNARHFARIPALVLEKVG